MAEPNIIPIPRELSGISLRQSRAIRDLLIGTSKEFQRAIRNVKRESDIERIRSKLRTISSETTQELGQILHKHSVESREISINYEINKLSITKLPTVDSEKWKEFLLTSRRVINISVNDFLTKKSYTDGKTLEFRLKTIKKGMSDTVEAIVRNGINDGKGPFQVAKEIDQYIRRDNRKSWVSPYTIMRREKGFPISSAYTGNVPAGSVDYNALRIARTELINNYRWSRIEATKGKDWMIGWKWGLSKAHPQTDDCDIWASTDNGYGPGVYVNSADVLAFGHPNCFCQLSTVTVFDKEMEKYFDKVKKELGKPIEKYQ